MTKKIIITRGENGGVTLDYEGGVTKNDVLVMTAALIVHIANVLKMTVKEVTKVIYITTKRLTERKDETASDK